MTDYTDLLNAWHEQAGPDHPIWRYNGKMEGRALAESLGIRVAKLLGGPATLDELRPPDHPFALKPVSGHGGKGVLLLEPVRSGSLHRNMMTEITAPWETWAQTVAQATEEWVDERTPQDKVAGPWILEEFVGTLVADYNVWVVDGRAMLVHKRMWVGGAWHHRAWAGDGTDAGNIWGDTSIPFSPLPEPRDLPSLIEASEEIAGEVEGPAIRVDFYEDAVGVVFGEITPHSSAGRHRFSDEWERRLGEAWPKARLFL